MLIGIPCPAGLLFSLLVQVPHLMLTVSSENHPDDQIKA